MNKKQEFRKAFFVLCLGIVIASIAYSQRDRVLAYRKPIPSVSYGTSYTYTPCEIYSSVPGQYHVKMKFMIPSADQKQLENVHRNMSRIKDHIFTNISSDTEMGDNLKNMKWGDLKKMLIEAVNDFSDEPIETIYLQEALVLDIR